MSFAVALQREGISPLCAPDDCVVWAHNLIFMVICAVVFGVAFGWDRHNELRKTRSQLRQCKARCETLEREVDLLSGYRSGFEALVGISEAELRARERMLRRAGELPE